MRARRPPAQLTVILGAIVGGCAAPPPVTAESPDPHPHRESETEPPSLERSEVRAVPERPASNDDREVGVSPTTHHPTVTDTPSPVVLLPGSPGAFPLVLVAHGAGGSPEWGCAWGTSLLDRPAVVACLRGIPMDRSGGAFYYPEHHSLGRWIEATRGYLTDTYAGRLVGPQVYVAYSQGATMGALALQTAAETLPHLVLVEGGVDGWTAERTARYAAAGGRSVYFACGTQSCRDKAERASRVLEEAGVRSRVGYAPGAGHSPSGEVGRWAKLGLQWSLQTSEEDEVAEDERGRPATAP